MVSIYDVDTNTLLAEVAKELKKLPAINAPEWADFVKTGHHKERAPVDPDWWYVRVAAVLRSVQIKGPIGVAKLQTKYGGKKNRGVQPGKFFKASGNILRKALQQLEAEELIRKNPNNSKAGRIIAPKGQSILEKTAASIALKVRSSAKPKASVPKKEKKVEADKPVESAKETTKDDKESEAKEAKKEKAPKSEPVQKNSTETVTEAEDAKESEEPKAEDN